jgi:hypothetical protein
MNQSHVHASQWPASAHIRYHIDMQPDVMSSALHLKAAAMKCNISFQLSFKDKW